MWTIYEREKRPSTAEEARALCYCTSRGELSHFAFASLEAKYSRLVTRYIGCCAILSGLLQQAYKLWSCSRVLVVFRYKKKNETATGQCVEVGNSSDVPHEVPSVKPLSVPVVSVETKDTRTKASTHTKNADYNCVECDGAMERHYR